MYCCVQNTLFPFSSLPLFLHSFVSSSLVIPESFGGAVPFRAEHSSASYSTWSWSRLITPAFILIQTVLCSVDPGLHTTAFKTTILDNVHNVELSSFSDVPLTQRLWLFIDVVSCLSLPFLEGQGTAGPLCSIIVYRSSGLFSFPCHCRLHP